MSSRLDKLEGSLRTALGERVVKLVNYVDELTLEVKPADLISVCDDLRAHGALKFEQLIDLCGMDYSDYGNGGWEGQRYAVVYHLLSVTHNHRLRLRVFAADDEFPVVPTIVNQWSSGNWLEREAFDLFGIMFEDHPDLRRLLTDYGFVGHPFRKDFPMIGNVEMRYDPDQQRVVYQPVSIDERNNVPRVIREEGFHHG